VAKRRSQISTKQPARPATRASSKHVTLLLTQRDALMTEIAMWRSRATVPSSSISKAGTLLTRYWSKADWEARAEILRAARWLLNVGKMQSRTGVAKVG
jgi:hypothetical protein